MSWWFCGISRTYNSSQSILWSSKFSSSVRELEEPPRAWGRSGSVEQHGKTVARVWFLRKRNREFFENQRLVGRVAENGPPSPLPASLHGEGPGVGPPSAGPTEASGCTGDRPTPNPSPQERRGEFAAPGLGSKMCDALTAPTTASSECDPCLDHVPVL